MGNNVEAGGENQPESVEPPIIQTLHERFSRGHSLVARTEAESLIAELREAIAERDAWKSLSVTAIAAENPNVAEYVTQLEDQVRLAQDWLSAAKAEHGKTLLLLHKAAFETIPQLEATLSAIRSAEVPKMPRRYKSLSGEVPCCYESDAVDLIIKSLTEQLAMARKEQGEALERVKALENECAAGKVLYSQYRNEARAQFEEDAGTIERLQGGQKHLAELCEQLQSEVERLSPKASRTREEICEWTRNWFDTHHPASREDFDLPQLLADFGKRGDYWKGESDGPCGDCGRSVEVWFCDNELWNSVSASGLLCIRCFLKKAEAKAWNKSAWKLLPDVSPKASPAKEPTNANQS